MSEPLPRAPIELLSKVINKQIEIESKELEKALRALDYRDIKNMKSKLLEIMKASCTAGATESAAMAAALYDQIRALQLGKTMGSQAYIPEDLDGRAEAAVNKSLQRFYKPGKQSEKWLERSVDSFVGTMAQHFDSEVRRSANYSMVANGKRDSHKPRYARVPTGAETCPWCIMLASRGFIYKTDEFASHSHSHCDCRIVPSWKGTEVEGYDPGTLYEQWQEYEAQKKANADKQH